MCHAMPFSARALKKNIFFDVDIVVKRNRNVVFRGLYSYRQRVSVVSQNRCLYIECKEHSIVCTIALIFVLTTLTPSRNVNEFQTV